MELIKRHYEKIILLALSIVSVLAVWRMTEVLAKTKEVKESDLEINIPPADYVPLSEMLKKYKAAEEKTNKSERESEIKGLRENGDFAAYLDNDGYRVPFLIKHNELSVAGSGCRDPRWSDNFSDLMQIFKMALCPNCDRGIPFNWLREGGRCNICGYALIAAPENPIKRRRITAKDLDGDGISNEDEKRYELDEKYAGDALLDDDKDGFSNLYEINVSKTEPNDVTSHPPLWMRLRYVKEDKVKLDINITGVHTKTKNPDDPKTWVATIEWKVRNLKTGRYATKEKECRIGETLKFSGRQYKVTDIKLLDEAKKSYAVTLETVDGDGNDKSLMHKLTLISDQQTYSPDKGVVLEDLGVPEEADKKRYWEPKKGQKQEALYILRPGDAFIMGATSYEAKRRIREVYRLESFDEKRKIAVLSLVDSTDPEKEILFDQNGKRMIVTKNGVLDPNDRVTIPKEAPPVTKKDVGKKRTRRYQED